MSTRFRLNTLLSLLSFWLAVSLLYPLPAQQGDLSIKNLQAHVKTLASPKLEGRLAIAPGAHKAADYIAGYFKKLGLEPKGTKGYFQDFDYTLGTVPGKNNRLSILSGGKKWKANPNQIRPLGLTTNNTVEAETVFVGYGIVDPDKNYDDYAGVDVQGKIVLVLRGTPEFLGNASGYGLIRKVRTAAEKGAVGFVLINLPANQYLMPMQSGQGVSGVSIVAMNVASIVGNRLLQPIGLDVRRAIERINTTQKPFSQVLPGVKVGLTAEKLPNKGIARNVLGFLPGNDPLLKEEMIVIGAHYDHLGYGETGSLATDPDGIHFGADDNASGTAGMLELARALAADRKNLKRSVLFMAFTAEEEGLVGSAHFTRNATVPLEKIAAMINMDMIGRLKNNRLTIGGVGTSPEWKELIEKVNDGSFQIMEDRSGMGASDHTSFYLKNIPVLFFFTGIHEDYHRPTDTWDKINYEGQARILRMVQGLVKAIDERPLRIAFTPTQSGTPSTGNRRTGSGVRLGLVPDYAENVEGVMLSGTSPGSPAEKAGLRAGDIVVALAGKRVKDIEELTALYPSLKPGEPASIVIIRDGKEIELTIVPAAAE
jgi:aminopeptidase YwaD